MGKQRGREYGRLVAREGMSMAAGNGTGIGGACVTINRVTVRRLRINPRSFFERGLYGKRLSIRCLRVTAERQKRGPISGRQEGAMQVRAHCVAGPCTFRCGSGAVVLRVRKNERTCATGRVERPICVPRPDKNADLPQKSPGPAAEVSRTCGKPRLHRQQKSLPPATLTDPSPPVHGNGVLGEPTGHRRQRVHKYPPPGVPKKKQKTGGIPGGTEHLDTNSYSFWGIEHSL